MTSSALYLPGVCSSVVDAVLVGAAVCSAPGGVVAVVVGVVEGPGAIGVTRSIMGATNPADAASGTIRGDFALSIGMNIIHGSDGSESAAREIALFFDESELCDYSRSVDAWIVE
jgi:nucleoside-diphosphate kinase